MSQIYINPSVSIGLPLDITDSGEITGATQNALVVGAAGGALTPLAVATDGQIPIGSTGNAPVLATITAGTNINITNAAGSITIDATGVGPEFADNLFRVTDDGDNTRKLAFECDQITTANTRTITMCDQDLSLISPSFPGSVTAGTGLTVTTGNATISAGNLNLPVTNLAFTEGVITTGGTFFIHNYGTNNSFFGELSGPSITTGAYNTGVGHSSLTATTTGDYNTCVGRNAGNTINTGEKNTGVGADILTSITTGDYNVVLGYLAGSSLNTDDSDNICIGNTGTAGDYNTIRIGTQGTGDGQQDNCFIAGIHGVTPAGATQTVVIDANGELGSTASPTNEFADNLFRVYDDGDNSKKIALECSGITASTTRTWTVDDRDIDFDAVPTTVSTDSGSATPASGSFTIAGSGSISTSGAGSTVTISGGGIIWNEVTGTSQTAAVNNGYIGNNVALVTITLPATASVGDVVRVIGLGAGGVKVGQNASQYIRWDESNVTTTGVGGSLASTDDHDAVELICTVTNNGWSVLSSKGNWTIT